MLVCLLVALPVAGLTLLDIEYRSRAGTEWAWSDDIYGAAEARITFIAAECSTCTRADAEQALPMGSEVVWSMSADLPIRTMDSSWAFAGVTTIDMRESTAAGLFELRSGRWPRGDDEAALSTSLMDSLDIRQGDSLQLTHQSSPFTIVGVIDDGNDDRDALVAPGFDMTVVRPILVQEVGLVDLPDVSASIGESYEQRKYAWSFRPIPDELLGDSQQSEVRRGLLLGWMGGVLAMSVFGVVIATAFAVSGRRQLVTIGQLSASGADHRTVVRALGLQGTLTGLLGAGVGLGIGLGLAATPEVGQAMFGDRLQPTVVRPLDLLVIVMTATVVATIAAIVPSRSLARVSVLSALAGRRPTGAVPRWITRAGSLAFTAGLILSMLAVGSGATGSDTAAPMLVVIGLLAAVIGVCALAPAIVEWVATRVTHRGATLRIAARGVARHRSRSAATFASLLLVGMATAGYAAFLEREPSSLATMWSDQMRADLVVVRLQVYNDDPSVAPDPTYPLGDGSDVRTAVDDLVDGPLTWVSSDIAWDGNNSYLVVDASVSALFGGMVEHLDGMYPVLPLADVTSRRLAIQRNAWWWGVADHEVTMNEAAAVSKYSDVSSDALWYVDGGDAAVGASTSIPVVRADETHDAAARRWILFGLALCLVGAIVAVAMALWAVEGRDERDVLIALGASPGSLARIAAWRAGGLSFAAMAIAVPVGAAVAQLFALTADGTAVVPWRVGGSLLVVIPAAIASGAFLTSAVGQRIRPSRLRPLTAD